MNYSKRLRRAGFTLAELLVVVALVAILAAIVLKLKQSLGSAGKMIESLALSFDNSYVVGAFDDGSVQAWAVADGRKVASLPPPADYAYRIALSANGNLVARMSFPADQTGNINAADAGCTLEICNVLTREQIRTRKVDSPGPMSFSHDGSRLVVVDFEGNQILRIDAHDAQSPEAVLAPFDPNAASRMTGGQELRNWLSIEVATNSTFCRQPTF